MAAKLGDYADEFIVGTWFANTVYNDAGGTFLPGANDGVPGTGWEMQGGLRIFDGGLVTGNAEAILVNGYIDGEKTLVLAIRGTDSDLTAALGQTWSATGQRGHYDLLQPLIAAAIVQVNNEANDYDNFIVAGHSMAGAIVDQFMLRDAGDVDESAVDMTLVALGSAGLDPDLFRQLGGDWNRHGALDDYLGISHSEDPVTYPKEIPGLWPHRVLDGHLHPSGDIHRVDLADRESGLYLFGDGENFGHEHKRFEYLTTARTILSDPTSSYVDAKPHVVKGGAGADRWSAGDGLDYMMGLGGDDTLFANGGHDVVSGGAGQDGVFGGEGNDTLNGGAGNDYLSGGNGTDTASYFGGPGSVMGPGNGADYELVWADLHRGTATTELYALNGSFKKRSTDQIVTVENVDGTHNDDRLVGDGGSNLLRSFRGDDRVDGAGGSDTLEAWAGDDSLQGGMGWDTLRSGAGDDLLRGDAPSDFDGAPTLMALNVGRYTSQYAAIGNYDGALTEDAFTLEMLLRPGSGPREAAEHFPTFASYHSASGGDELVIRASPVDHNRRFLQVILNGELIETDIRADSMFDGGLYRLSVGYDGTDGTVRIVMDDQIFEAIAPGIAPLTRGGTLVFGQEQNTVGGGFNDFETYRGDLADIRVWSGLRSVEEIRADAYRFVDPDAEGLSANWRDQAGRTIVDATGGTGLDFTKHRLHDNLPLTYVLEKWFDADLLEAGDGDDTLEGGIGGDTLDGGGGIDTASYANARFGVTVDLAGVHEQTGEAAGDQFISIENLLGSRLSDLLSGDDGANLLDGVGGNDTLEGGAGDDTLDGGSGADRLLGGTGNDVYHVDSARDRIVDAGGIDRVIVDGAFRFDVGRSGVEAVDGSDDATRLFVVGGRAAVEMTGTDGDDILASSGAADTMTGGAGADTFAFLHTRTPDGVRIVDFDGQDVLAFDDRLFEMGGPGVNLRPLGERQVLDLLKDGRVDFNARTEELSIDVDGRDGPGGFEVFATFDDVSALGLNDVMIF